MRGFFERWGLPKQLRVDNGHPWNRKNGLPSGLCLWLIGLGIDLIWNRPYHPQENGKIERGHGLIEPWVEPEKCADGAELQARVDWAMEVQREKYPAVDGQTRMEAYPKLAEVGRPYTRGAEAGLFDAERVYNYLAQGRWVRRVDKQGDISVYNRHYHVGRGHCRNEIYLHFDAQSRSWVIRDRDGSELIRHEAKDVTPENIQELTVGYTKPHRRERRNGQKAMAPDDT